MSSFRPLSQILDKASPSSASPKENQDPGKESSTITAAAELAKRRREKREELARLVGQGSSHCDLVAAEEVLSEKKLLSRLEARDAIEEKLLGQHEQECQVVTCLTVSSVFIDFVRSATSSQPSGISPRALLR